MSLITVDSFSFECTACGNCCDSAPQMTLPELFFHEERFFGCLTLKRVPSLKQGLALGNPREPIIATDEDVFAFRELSRRILHAPRTLRRTGTVPDTQEFWVAIGGQGLTLPSEERCPMRSVDGRCFVYELGKPRTCSAVPLDALYPDRLQRAVLSARKRDASYLNAECLKTTTKSDQAFVNGPHVEAGARAVLAEHRDALELEKRHWADAVFAELSEHAPAEFWSTLPTDGYFEMALAPALLVLSQTSLGLRERCQRYVEAQLRLGTKLLDSATSRKRPQDYAVRQRLRTQLETHQVLRHSLRNAAESSRVTPERAREVEAWLSASPQRSSPGAERNLSASC